MNIGKAKAGFFVGTNIFKEFIQELYDRELFPNIINQENDQFKKNITALLDKPNFLIINQNGERYPQLHLTGSLELRPLKVTDGEPEMVMDLSIKARMEFVLRPVPNKAPVLSLQYVGVDGAPSSPITAGDVDKIFTDPKISTMLNAIQIDLLGPMVDGLAVMYFTRATAPKDNEWPTELRILLPAMRSDNETCVGIFVALPGDSAAPVDAVSPLSKNMGFGMEYSREFMDYVLTKSAKRKEGKSMGGAKITRINLRMDDDAIFVDGAATKRGATITFKGPILVSLTRGTTRLSFNSEHVAVHVDVPDDKEWWLKTIKNIAKVCMFIPGLNLGAIFVLDKVWEIEDMIEDGVDAAPELAQHGLSGALSTGMKKIAKALSIQSNFGSIHVDSTPDHGMVKDGNLMLFSQIFVSTVVSTIEGAHYSEYWRKFTHYYLEDGRRFRAKELARLVAAKKVVVPGYHEVKGEYMRANPDNSTGNNLLKRFT